MPDPVTGVIYGNGVRPDGAYAIPPLDPNELAQLVRGDLAPVDAEELERRLRPSDDREVEEGVDATQLDEAGWGVLFAADADPEIEKALEPLLQHREEQAGRLFQRYSGDRGFRVGKDSKNSFLARYGVGPGPAVPDNVPYYLLIVGSPDKIPYQFQSQLDVQYAVGRIDFDTPEEYARYAESVVAAETDRVRLPRRASFFGVSHRLAESPTTWEPATRQSLDYLLDPLVQDLSRVDGWRFDSARELAATKAALQARLGGSETPALLFTASHGLDVTGLADLRLPQMGYQGALVCADWVAGQPVDSQVCMAGADIAAQRDANLLGLIAFFFACFGAGTPDVDAYTRLQRLRQRQTPGSPNPLASRPFVADLPKRMLSAPGGGALAVIGHIERCWPSSFLWLAKADGSLPPQTAAFASTLERVMRGQPVGHAVDYLNLRYAELATDLKALLDDAPSQVSSDMANVWMAANDAQWFSIVGDPAVRLPVVDDDRAQHRPTLTLNPRETTEIATPSLPPSVRVGEAEQQSTRPKEGPVPTSTDLDELFERPYSPIPGALPELDRLKSQHPDLYAAYVDHIKDGYRNNGRVFDDVLRAFMRSHNSTVIMYWVLFIIGATAVAAGIWLAVARDQALNGALFLGVGVAAFIGYFISRSVLSVEENLLYITWLGVIYNTYWTHLAWATDPGRAQADLDKATTHAIHQIQVLLDRHTKSTKERPTLEPSASANPAPALNARASTDGAGR